jgi:hypothetical protein
MTGALQNKEGRSFFSVIHSLTVPGTAARANIAGTLLK